jgi:hypothetical protein
LIKLSWFTNDIKPTSMSSLTHKKKPWTAFITKSVLT